MIRTPGIVLLVVCAAVCRGIRSLYDEVQRRHSENIQLKLWFDSEVNLNITFYTARPPKNKLNQFGTSKNNLNQQ